MMHHMKTISVSSSKREEMIDITAEIKHVLSESTITDGALIVYVPHTTAAVTINEGADPDVQSDITTTLNTLIPKNKGYRHVEGNSDAHIKASLIGSSVTIPISKKQLTLGTWQHIFFYEGDGPRTRAVHIQLLKNGA